MELYKQVVSLELAKRLKELKVRQESLFYWFSNATTGVWQLFPKEGGPDIYPFEDKVSAFTVAELGEYLPDNLVSSGMDSGKWDCIYGPRENGDDMPDSKWENHNKYEFGYIVITDNTEANVRAKMLIYLLENKLAVLK